MGFWDIFKKNQFANQEQRATLNDLLNMTQVKTWNSFQDLSVGIKRTELRQLYATDDEITAATDTRMEACINTPWIIEAADEKGKKLADKINEMMTPIIGDILNFSWWAVPYGYSVIQLLWEFSKEWKPIKVIDQPFEAFSVQRDGTLKLVSNQSEVLLPEKFISTVRKPTWSCPSGEALFQRLYTPYFYRLNIWEFWVQFLESWGKPFLHAKLSTADEAVRNFVTNELLKAKRPRGIATTDKVTLDVIEAAANGSISFNEAQLRLAERIQRLILGQTLTSGVSTSGSLALGEVHDQVRDDKRISDCKMIEVTVNKIIGYIMQLNGMSEAAPVFKFMETESLDKARADRDMVLFNQGVRPTKEYYKEKYDLEDDDFDVIEPPVAGAQNQFSHDHSFLKFAEQSELVRAQIQTENSVIRKTDNVFSDDEIRVAVKESKTKEELVSNLAKLMGKQSDEFEDQVTKGNFMANVEGFDHGSETD